ncbi:SSI family serine proteinase inhibitor [Streptomyces sp. NPDC088554]|uniref:SSI family serine proteinase inhibitor n=1 Tax=Streptomyces sp. NPDC088554 TaxID=3365865 RepID=UPI00380651B1
MALRRLVPLLTAVSAALLVTGFAPGDSLTVRVAGGSTYTLKCSPVGGSHPSAGAACARLAELGGGGRDPFAPVAGGSLCTMQYGGTATARITGTWQGKRVNAVFDRKNGCEISRWRALEPVLPSVTS